VSDDTAAESTPTDDSATTDDSEGAPTAAAVLAHVVRSIVDEPDAVVVEASRNGDRTRLDVRVADGELGRVIGRRGRTASSIRTVTRAAAAKDGVEVDIEFVDD
jgi:uncharacterized protein